MALVSLRYFHNITGYTSPPSIFLDSYPENERNNIQEITGYAKWFIAFLTTAHINAGNDKIIAKTIHILYCSTDQNGALNTNFEIKGAVGPEPPFSGGLGDETIENESSI